MRNPPAYILIYTGGFFGYILLEPISDYFSQSAITLANQRLLEPISYYFSQSVMRFLTREVSQRMRMNSLDAEFL